MSAQSTRRGILGAIAAVPLVRGAVAPAFASSDLEVLIAEYQASSVRLTAGNEASEPQTHKRLATASRRLYDRFWRVVDRQVRLRLSNRCQAAYSDEVGRVYRPEVGHRLRCEAGRLYRSDLLPWAMAAFETVGLSIERP